MGAIVGGLYATGMSAAELEELVGSIDWAGTLSDDPPRRDLSFRRKQDDAEFPIDVEVGLRGTDLVLPKGAIQGQKLDLLLRELTMPASHITDFDDLAIPFRAVASNIETGDAYVLGNGDLATAIRASMSVPGVFAPVRVDGHLLVDGGLVGNLPVNVMEEMGVDVIIAVNVEFPLYSPEELESVVTISEQMLTIMVRKETLRQIDRLGEDDILITPELGTYASTNFADIVTAVEPGIAAALDQAAKLGNLSVDDAAWEAYLAERQLPPSPATRLAFVRITDDGELAPQVLESRLTVRQGDPIDAQVLANNAERLYGLQLYEKVDYRLVEENGGTGVVYRAVPKSWGPTFLQLGVQLEDDFDGSTGFNVAARVTRAAINSLGAEWRTDLRLGTDPEIRTEFYQPLSFDSRLFVAPQAAFRQDNFDVFLDGQAVSRARITRGDVGLDVGRELGNVGEFRVGIYRGQGNARVTVGAAAPAVDFNSGGAYARLRFDTLDNAYFPRHGIYADLLWTLSRENFGADENFDTIEGEFSNTWSHGNNSLQLGLAYATTLDSDDAFQDYFRLGGFLSLSGLRRGEISGPHAALARVVYYRRIGETTGGILDTPVYFGISAEAGNTWPLRSEMSFDSMLVNGSLFTGVDTFLGPIFLGAGFGEDGETNFYLFIGSPRR
jgi:NTE family protein